MSNDNAAATHQQQTKPSPLLLAPAPTYLLLPEQAESLRKRSVRTKRTQVTWAPDAPSPEEFLPAPRRPKGLFEVWPSPAEATPAVAFVVLCVLTTWSTSVVPSDHFVASGTRVYQHHEFWRLVSALFVHGDFSHLGFNMLSLLFFAWLLFAYFGVLAFPVLAIVSGILSNAVTIALYDPETRLLGASGMIYGMMAMWLLLYLKTERNIGARRKLLRVTGFLLMMVFPHTYEPGTSYLAHASGFASGVLLGFLCLPLLNLKKRSGSPEQC